MFDNSYHLFLYHFLSLYRDADSFHGLPSLLIDDRVKLLIEASGGLAS